MRSVLVGSFLVTVLLLLISVDCRSETYKTAAPLPTAVPTETPTASPMATVTPTNTLEPSPTPSPTLVPTSTPSPEPTLIPATPTVAPTSVPVSTTFIATRYGRSYNGLPLGCGVGSYNSSDPTILAAPPARYTQWPCGTALQLCYQGRCINVVRKGSCPGCGPNHVDLSEEGLRQLAGVPSCNYDDPSRPSGCDVLSGITITVR